MFIGKYFLGALRPGAIDDHYLPIIVWKSTLFLRLISLMVFSIRRHAVPSAPCFRSVGLLVYIEDATGPNV
jgi:hypothetical protein